jgi:hypothetical protein
MNSYDKYLEILDDEKSIENTAPKTVTRTFATDLQQICNKFKKVCNKKATRKIA